MRDSPPHPLPYSYLYQETSSVKMAFGGNSRDTPLGLGLFGQFIPIS